MQACIHKASQREAAVWLPVSHLHKGNAAGAAAVKVLRDVDILHAAVALGGVAHVVDAAGARRRRREQREGRSVGGRSVAAEESRGAQGSLSVADGLPPHGRCGGAGASWERRHSRRWLRPTAAVHRRLLQAAPARDRRCWGAAEVRGARTAPQAAQVMPRWRPHRQIPGPSDTTHVASGASRRISRLQPVGASRGPGGGPFGGLLLLLRPLGDLLRLL